MRKFIIAIGVILGFNSIVASAEEIGSVSTVFKMLGPNHKIVIEAFDDPDIPGVSCWLSRPKTGGISGGLGLAEDPSNGSIACRQIGEIELPDDLEEGEKVFNKRTSLVFKTLQVVRFYDRKRHTLIYLVYSDKVIEGSPKNSISVVAIQPWLTQTR
ncbi:CreA family protein [Oceanospirillum maris]|uniref:CreA family protein n=1 Tax=Oceanospirillum maris TaxID=64977 RepID=UPI0003F9182A|nr:CreA family protein [Oceanospirillum maris]